MSAPFDQPEVRRIFLDAVDQNRGSGTGETVGPDAASVAQAMKATACFCARVADGMTFVADGIGIAQGICSVFGLDYPEDRDEDALVETLRKIHSATRQQALKDAVAFLVDRGELFLADSLNEGLQ